MRGRLRRTGLSLPRPARNNFCRKREFGALAAINPPIPVSVDYLRDTRICALLAANVWDMRPKQTGDRYTAADANLPKVSKSMR